MAPIAPAVVLAVLVMQAPPAGSEVEEGVRPSPGSGRTDGGAESREGGAPQAQDQAPTEPKREDATAQKKLDDAVEKLRAELAGSQERIAALEARIAELEAREAALAEQRAAESRAAEETRAAAERSPQVRAESFGAALGSLDATLRNLTAGDGAAAAAQLDAIREPLLEARAEAGRFEATREAAAATTALQALDAAEQALARGDLWAARVAATLASREAAAANALASQGAAARPAY